MRKVVLSVLAHPDDAEFLCAGALIRLVKEHGWEAHIASMTPGERKDPDKLNGSRRLRIAKGSGRTVQEVNQLVAQFKQMQKFMKIAGKPGALGGAFGRGGFPR